MSKKIILIKIRFKYLSHQLIWIAFLNTYFLIVNLIERNVTFNIISFSFVDFSIIYNLLMELEAL